MLPSPADREVIEGFFREFDRRMADPDASAEFVAAVKPLRPLLAFNAKADPAAFVMRLEETLVELGLLPDE